jgi:hypothetical protein
MNKITHNINKFFKKGIIIDQPDWKKLDSLNEWQKKQADKIRASPPFVRKNLYLAL